MYNKHSIQIGYRREIYAQVAAIAYSGLRGNQFKWLPYSVVSRMEKVKGSSEVSSDLDYAAESCRAALGLEPENYKEALCGKAEFSLREASERASTAQPTLCALKSVCHKCANIMGENRPCVKACKNGAISADSLGRTVIDASKCDSCGKCMCACEYGAIIDKSSIYQLVSTIGKGKGVYALLAPGISAQFAEHFGQDEITAAFRLLGFADTAELECGRTACEKLDESCGGWRSADSKAHSSCCVNDMNIMKDAIEKETELIHDSKPAACITLIVPCSVSKLTASRMRAELGVDYVLDFEEVSGMLDARGIDRGIIWNRDIEPLQYIS